MTYQYGTTLKTYRAGDFDQILIFISTTTKNKKKAGWGRGGETGREYLSILPKSLQARKRHHPHHHHNEHIMSHNTACWQFGVRYGY